MIDLKQHMTQLERLEAESIYIIREVAAEFDNPVMLYSIGKDSSVLLHLARKAFHPGKLPFPLMHIDTTWKFREMIAFRDQMARELGFDLIVHTNVEAAKAGVSPFTHGSRYTDVMKTEALKAALSKHKFDAAFGGARRDEEKSRAKERVYSFRDRFGQWDPRTSGPSCGTSTTRIASRARTSGSSRCRTGPSSTSGSTSTRKTSRSCRCITRANGRW